ncbi:hypothetical protein GCM10008931_41040 [Oceanobacillus oncorhynchi subsp. oncorhynchi]|uniref:hypothetical protein n=1 Tax=Oceanobacillus oncorhynchi TaxID=545501 RepID=UPI0031D34BDE
MDIKKPKIKKFDLGNVEWGSPEFNKIVREMEQQEKELKEYKKAVKAVKTIQGDY